MAQKKKDNISLPEDVLEATEAATLDFTKSSGSYKIDDSVLVKVKSTYFGRLFYRNKKTGESTEWLRAGDIQIVSMGDLRAMKATQVAFFKNQWLVILGLADGSECQATCADIYKALVITQYYQNYIEPTNVSAICSWNEKEIAERVAMMSAGAQENLVVTLNECIKNGALDSIRSIRAFENALGCRLRDLHDEEDDK